uniref:Uncharacterized protein n=1 Tax=Peronospora matthiolae TaxID=2874970 RepID=A0AAV1TDU4_9STRA
MKRNFGSLNLTALDMNRPSADCSLEDRFSALGSSVEDHSLDAGFEYGGDGNVGFPLEHFHGLVTDLSVQSLCCGSSQDVDTDMEETSFESIESAFQARSEDGSGRLRQVHCPTSPEMPHELQNVELNALRRLSLKVMLSTLSTSKNSSSTSGGHTNVASTTKPMCAYPGVNGRVKTALLPIRHPSLQSV